MFLYGNIRFILRFTLGFVLRLSLGGGGVCNGCPLKQLRQRVVFEKKRTSSGYCIRL